MSNRAVAREHVRVLCITRVREESLKYLAPPGNAKLRICLPRGNCTETDWMKGTSNGAVY